MVKGGRKEQERGRIGNIVFTRSGIHIAENPVVKQDLKMREDKLKGQRNGDQGARKQMVHKTEDGPKVD